MPNSRRVVIPGLPHHVCHRGNYRQAVFFEDQDWELYLDMLRKRARSHGVAIHGYCLMPNHVHIIATPRDPDGLHLTFERVQGDYARAVHARIERRGHLWQGRFHSSAMDEDHFWTALVYVETNPVRAKLVAAASEWPWSSARARLTGRDADWLDLNSWRARFSPAQWKERLALGINKAALLDRIREGLRRGRPVVSEEHLERLEAEFGFPMPRLGRGRPRKKGANQEKGAAARAS